MCHKAYTPPTEGEGGQALHVYSIVSGVSMELVGFGVLNGGSTRFLVRIAHEIRRWVLPNNQ